LRLFGECGINIGFTTKNEGASIDMTTESQMEQENRQAEIDRGVRRWLTRESMGVLFVALTLFIPAGRLDWGMGWALVGVYGVWVAANALILIPRCPELLAERAMRKTSSKTWDTVLLSIFGLATLAKYIIAGLDVRYGWTAEPGMALQLTALVLAALGYALGTWSMAANAFFATVYHIQEERGHSVAKSGPYRYVRHPGYAGSIVFELATPIMLGSLWALIPGGLSALILVVRTALEDRALQQELPGYAEYARQTRQRLLPGVW
jgi:protein-S-isoprenylcysteine O-methyltransferase Ste14